ILLGLSSIFSGVLQYFNRFLVYSLSPILYNLGIILGIVLGAPSLGVFGVALGVILGALLHFLIQVPSAVQAGFHYKPVFDFKDPKIKRVFSLMLPRTLGVAAPQINLMVVTFIASSLPSGALAIFSLSNNLQQFPLGLIGIPFAMAAFPVLSRSFAAKNKEEFSRFFSKTFRQVLYLAVPLSFLIFIFRNQIIEIILKSGRFSESSAQLASASLGLFVLGVFATSLIPLVFRAFFAVQDTKTPTVIAVLAMILNVVLSFGFVWLLGFSNPFRDFIVKIFSLQNLNNIAVLGLPLAFSVDSILQFILLMVFIKGRIAKKF
ncbi:MAG: lipid II flippase MurJ, partial [bacterium]|nr:lipid II flippase MurJ [bacterium]